MASLKNTWLDQSWWIYSRSQTVVLRLFSTIPTSWQISFHRRSDSSLVFLWKTPGYLNSSSIDYTQFVYNNHSKLFQSLSSVYLIWGMFNVTSIQVSVRLSVPPEQQFLPALVANLSLMPGACMHVCSVMSNFLQPVDSSPPVSSVHGLSRKEYGVGCHLLL